MSQAVPSIMVQSWPWSNQTKIILVLKKSPWPPNLDSRVVKKQKLCSDEFTGYDDAINIRSRDFDKSDTPFQQG